MCLSCMLRLPHQRPIPKARNRAMTLQDLRPAGGDWAAVDRLSQLL